jgi:hypothetical protein
MISHPLAIREANQETKLVAQLNLGRCQGNGRSTVDTVFHRVPNTLRDVKEALLEALVLSELVTGGGVRGLAKRLQLCL